MTDAACPFGAYDRRVIAGLRWAGYGRVYTSDGGTTPPDDFIQARTSLGPTDGLDVGRIAYLDRPRTWAGRRAKLVVKRWW